MNDNSGATPNPLNPTPTSGVNDGLAEAPSAPVAATSADSTATPSDSGDNASLEVATNATTNEEATTVTPTAVPAESLNPVGGSVEQGTELPQSPRKSKTGLIVGIIIACVLLLGGAIGAAIMMMNSNRGDAVSIAMQKVLSGKASKNVAIDGVINILLNDTSAPIKRVNINLDSDIVVGSMINTSSAVITFTDKKDQDYSMKIEEIYATNNNLFFKIEGAADAIQQSGLLNLVTSNTQQTNCIADETGMTNCDSPAVMEVDCADEEDCEEIEGEIITQDKNLNSALADALVSIIEAADGVYIKLSSEDLDLVGVESIETSSLSCISDLISNADKDSESTIQIYNQYPFVLSTDKNIPIASKQNPIYQISLDSKNLVGFINGIQNTEIVKSWYSCLGMEDNLAITENDTAELISRMPKVYTEINNENNFTRLYLESDLNGEATATIDLGFSYPTNVNVSEPVEYTDFKDFIQTIFEGM